MLMKKYIFFSILPVNVEELLQEDRSEYTLQWSESEAEHGGYRIELLLKDTCLAMNFVP